MYTYAYSYVRMCMPTCNAMRTCKPFLLTCLHICPSISLYVRIFVRLFVCPLAACISISCWPGRLFVRFPPCPSVDPLIRVHVRPSAYLRSLSPSVCMYAYIRVCSSVSTCMSVCLRVCLCIISTSMHQFLCLCICRSECLKAIYYLGCFAFALFASFAIDCSSTTPFVRLSICLSVYLSVCSILSVRPYMSVFLHACLLNFYRSAYFHRAMCPGKLQLWPGDV